MFTVGFTPIMGGEKYHRVAKATTDDGKEVTYSVLMEQNFSRTTFIVYCRDFRRLLAWTKGPINIFQLIIEAGNPGNNRPQLQAEFGVANRIRRVLSKRLNPGHISQPDPLPPNAKEFA